MELAANQQLFACTRCGSTCLSSCPWPPNHADQPRCLCVCSAPAAGRSRRSSWCRFFHGRHVRRAPRTRPNSGACEQCAGRHVAAAAVRPHASNARIHLRQPRTGRGCVCPCVSPNVTPRTTRCCCHSTVRAPVAELPSRSAYAICILWPPLRHLSDRTGATDADQQPAAHEGAVSGADTARYGEASTRRGSARRTGGWRSSGGCGPSSPCGCGGGRTPCASACTRCSSRTTACVQHCRRRRGRRTAAGE
jgi:hypothetical protein